MSTDTAQSEMQSFYAYLGRRIANGDQGLSPEQCVREFRVYQQELERFIRETQPAIQQSQRGESQPLDVEAIMQRVHKRLAEESGSG